MTGIESEPRLDHEFSMSDAKQAFREAGVNTKTRLSFYDQDGYGPILGTGFILHIVYLAKDSEVGPGWLKFTKDAFTALGKYYAQQPGTEQRAS